VFVGAAVFFFLIHAQTRTAAALHHGNRQSSEDATVYLLSGNVVWFLLPVSQFFSRNKLHRSTFWACKQIN
jgi:hypothetical protein